jgi:hypothetical protein
MPGGFPFPGDLCNATSINSAITAFSNGASAGPTPGATANTKGSWTQLIAATTVDAIHVRLDMYLQTAFAASESIAVDIGIGASGSEQVLIPNLVFSTPGQFQSMKCQYNFRFKSRRGSASRFARNRTWPAIRIRSPACLRCLMVVSPIQKDALASILSGSMRRLRPRR